MTTTDPVVSEEERKKKSVYYESCTSAFKDDLPVLVTCLKSDKGDPHSRQEAGFLLWHHALEGNDLAGLLGAGILPACIANLDSPPSALLPAERACSAGILLSLATGNQEVSEQVVRTRSPSGRSSLEVLHAHLREDAAMTRQCCCRLLHLLAKQIPQAVLKAMDHQLPYLPAYTGVWTNSDQRDAPVVTAVSCMVALLVQARPDLADVLVAAGTVTPLLDVLRSQKSEAACCGALTLLLKLLPVEAAVGEFISQGGIPLLVDVVGPPPRLTPPPAPPAAAIEEDPEAVSPAPPASPPSGRPSLDEGGRWAPPRASLDATGAAVAVAVSQLGDDDAGDGVSPHAGSSLLHGVGSASMAARVQLPLVIPGIQSTGASAAATPSAQQLQAQQSLARLAAVSSLGAEASTISLGGLSLGAATASATSLAGMYGNAAADAGMLPPPQPPPSDITTNRCGLRWIMLPGLEVASLAAAGLTALVQQRPECLAEAEHRLVSHRIVAQVKAAMAAASGGSAGAAKKTKKKGLGLTAEQTASLTRLVGLLKFLSLMNATRYRIAKLGAVPALVRLYEEGTDYLLRNHSQAVLSNVALLAENGQALKDGKTPEEFLVANPMRLSPQSRAVLRWEFPDEAALAS